jgi:predicted amidohydrolase YtcJ
LNENYVNSDHRGEFNYTEDELVKILYECSKNNISLHYHVVGDAAFNKILEMLKRMECSKSIYHTLAHVQFVDEKAIDLVNDLREILNFCFSPFWFYKDAGYRNLISLSGLRRAYNSYPIKLFKNNVIGFGSDWPVSTLNPFKSFEVAVTRSGLNEFENQFDKLNEIHCLSVEEALLSYTMGSAKLLGLDGLIGSLEVGKTADMIIVDQNIFETENHLIHKTKVLNTIIDGQIVFEGKF